MSIAYPMGAIIVPFVPAGPSEPQPVSSTTTHLGCRRLGASGYGRPRISCFFSWTSASVRGPSSHRAPSERIRSTKSRHPRLLPDGRYRALAAEPRPVPAR